MKETQEIRTSEQNLLLCKLKSDKEDTANLEIKNGKRVDSLPLEEFIAQVNRFLISKGKKLYIETVINLDELVC